DKPGKDNTDQTLKLAAERADELGINEVVVATTTGRTAYKAMEVFAGKRLTAVTYHCGFKEPLQNRMEDDVRKDIEGTGIRVIASSHALSGVERSVAKKHSGVYPVLLIADTLRLLGQGTKVAVEVAVMAADAGTLTGNDIISVGGSGGGADAALVLKPAHQNNFFDLRIREIICKPRMF
ncbi:MAG: pyruvate kinase alpha/beta domain-containing protein, partial [Desulfobacterales bacterium]